MASRARLYPQQPGDRRTEAVELPEHLRRAIEQAASRSVQQAGYIFSLALPLAAHDEADPALCDIVATTQASLEVSIRASRISLQAASMLSSLAPQGVVIRQYITPDEGLSIRWTVDISEDPQSGIEGCPGSVFTGEMALLLRSLSAVEISLDSASQGNSTFRYEGGGEGADALGQQWASILSSNLKTQNDLVFASAPSGALLDVWCDIDVAHCEATRGGQCLPLCGLIAAFHRARLFLRDARIEVAAASHFRITGHVMNGTGPVQILTTDIALFSPAPPADGLSAQPAEEDDQHEGGQSLFSSIFSGLIGGKRRRVNEDH